MEDDLKSRRRNATEAFRTRRAALGLTQKEVADIAGVVLRTVQNFEYGVRSNPRTFHKLEMAVGWPPGEIRRLQAPAKDYLDTQLLDRISELSDGQLENAAAWIQALLAQRRVDTRRRSAGG